MKNEKKIVPLLVGEKINRPKRRPLTASDLERMGLPYRYWTASFEKILPVNSEHKKQIEIYLKKLDEMLASGYGLILWGGNNTGKTSCVAVIGKEVRRRGKTVFFVRASSFRDNVISKKQFDDSHTVYERACEVDFLIVDDLGKNMSGTGYDKEMYEDVVRCRTDELKPTVITTNLGVKGLSEEFLRSTLKVMEASFMPIKVEGWDYRETERREMKGLFAV